MNTPAMLYTVEMCIKTLHSSHLFYCVIHAIYSVVFTSMEYFSSALKNNFMAGNKFDKEVNVNVY